MTAEEEAIKARREAAENENEGYAATPMGIGHAIERATTVTPEEFDRAYLVLISELGQGYDWQALQAAFGAAGFEVQS